MAKKVLKKPTPTAAAAPPPAAASPPAAPEPEQAFAFPSKSKCPRCGSLNTVARATDGPIQYRACKMAICRRPYKVVGQKV